MVLYHWSQSTRLVREGALGPLSFIYERQYTEQFVDNQQEQKTVNLAELKHVVCRSILFWSEILLSTKMITGPILIAYQIRR